VSKKSDLIQDLVAKVELPHELPSTDMEGTLLERGLYAILLREIPASRARSAVQELRKDYEDYNEARVSQAQELAGAIAPKGKGLARLAKYLPAARLTKRYLQAVFQETHGLDLEFIVEDPVAGGRQLASIELLGGALTSYLLFVAEGGEMPVLAGTIRVLDRLGVMTRTSSVRKAREGLSGLIDEKDRLRVSYALAMVSDRWCDSRKPACWDCALLDDCPNGKKVFKEWKVQQERLEKQRAKEEVRMAAVAKKDAARALREAEREVKRRAADAKKAKRSREMLKREASKRVELQRKKAAAAKIIEDKKKAVAKEVAAKKKAASRKKAAAKKKASKKATAKKVVKKATTKKVVKKPAAKKASTKKTTAKKASTAKKRPAAKKTVAKKAKKAPAKKKTSR